MQFDEDALWRAVGLGEDSKLELKEVRFSGSRLTAPRRDTIADELGAFANASGGRLVLGVKDDGSAQALNRDELDELIGVVGAICRDTIQPPIEHEAHRVAHPQEPGRGVLVVVVPAGPTVHSSPGGHYQRHGHAKRQMSADGVRRLLLRRGQSDATAVDSQVVAGTGVNSLDQGLWRRYVSSRPGDSPETRLAKLKFIKKDAAGVQRATLGGVLLATSDPREWLPNAYIQAVHYRGRRMDGDQQLDAQDVTGPLDAQVRGAASFVARNQRVAAYKSPQRHEVPQYSARGVFEALVNAVVHRDYSISGSHIRLFMFDDRLELYSPGALGNSMTVEDLRTTQFTRNQLLADRLGRCPVEDAVGAGERDFFIEQRGEGIRTIEEDTFALTGQAATFELIGQRELRLTLPAAAPPLPERLALAVRVTDAATHQPLPDAHVLALYPNKTFHEAKTDAFGRADFRLHSRLPMCVFCAAPGYAAAVVTDRMPNGTLPLALQPKAGGSAIIAKGIGHVPGIQGHIDPILDQQDRMYLYTDNVAINDGMTQPVRFDLGEPLRLTDAAGTSATIWFREMRGASCVFDYQLDAR